MQGQHIPTPVRTGRYDRLDGGNPAAFDICVASPLNTNGLSAAGATAGAASEAAELRKHTANDAMCTELGWVSIPLVVGKEAQQCLSDLHLALLSKTVIKSFWPCNTGRLIHCHLNLTRQTG